ncbi:two-component system, NtrC family, sensor kinase [Poseidonocella pacifica]|uniref:histidine kinase n=1 Tax=Poseidonocella pacifica TaxID=871651 RepID=A0A1I0XXC0_9RHOB|nr:cache domain-containing protein [Poseidonocella pacifica]SFB04593.1 two-component system, NtrC family, sensor kinase [Poseidonocella pacifica]
MTITRSIRVRLLLIALLPMLVLFPLLLGTTMQRWSSRLDDLLIVKVNGDLTIADQYLRRLQENAGERIAALADSAAFASVVDEPAARADVIAQRKRDAGLDFLYLTDGRSAPWPGFVPADWPVVRSALDGARQSAVDILDATELDALSPGLAVRAAIPLVDTEAARASTREVEDRGMIVHAAAPVRMPDGREMALVGGILLNRNLAFIDTINDLVYRDRSLPEGSQGTATLFLDDVRISTNVRLFEGVRALGTRVSEAVHDRVLVEGETWLDRAFVVDDWYISAYRPIQNSRGERVGMLYVGFLEAPFQQAKITPFMTGTLTFLVLALLLVPVFLRWAGLIFKPLERMTQTIARVEAGDLNARNGDIGAENEITRVAAHLDTLLDQVQERDRRLRGWASELNQKVEERTADLRDSNRRLEEATERLIMSEKLAAVGEITAGVAHEINNPIAVIQGNLDVARGLLGPEADKAATEFKLIDDQVHRIGAIVSRLLQFSRPGEFSGSDHTASPSEVVNDCLLLTRHELDAARIEVETSLQSIRTVPMERTELQQVVVNLIINALHAVKQEGRLSISVEDANDGVIITVADTGVGMSRETLRHIFDPFFTTKQAEGTGLGLSISQRLVTEAGGRLTAESVEGEGSTFHMWLPATPDSDDLA